MRDVVVTMFEGSHHHGVAALVNSLESAGFRGTIRAGYLGELPAWARAASDSPGRFGCEIVFSRLETERHLTYHKPAFVEAVWAERPEAGRVFYMDPDVVLLRPWSFVEFWADGGLALVEDVGKFRMAGDHPLRRSWVLFMRELGIEARRPVDRYFNAGFVGLTTSTQGFLEVWESCVDAVYRQGPRETGSGHLHSRAATGPQTVSPEVLSVMGVEYLVDQDALNMAVMASDVAISAMGPEAMAFVPGGAVMTHAVGGTKPWERHAVADLLLRGRRPGLADQAYWQHATGIVQSQPDALIRRRRLELTAARALSRHAGR